MKERYSVITHNGVDLKVYQHKTYMKIEADLVSMGEVTTISKRYKMDVKNMTPNEYIEKSFENMDDFTKEYNSYK